ncbi:MAG: D-aminoacyl-tRNA deacylase, partial [Candidatus Desulfatibia sp.]
MRPPDALDIHRVSAYRFCIIMRAVIQRVKSSSVTVGNETVGKIDSGLLVLLGVAKPDQTAGADFLAEKIVNLRIFEDEQGKMN